MSGLRACLGPEPVVLEIGFGRAEVLMELSLEQPDRRFLGVEVSRKRAVKAARRIERAGIEGVRITHATAEYLLERALSPSSIAECWINFPDPWPKKRHHKRRLIRPSALEHLGRVMEPGATLHVATDHVAYAEWIACVLSGADSFRNLHAPAPWSRERPSRIETAYESEFLAEGRTIAYFDYERSP